MAKYPCHDEQDIRQHDIDSFDVMLPAPLQVGVTSAFVRQNEKSTRLEQ